MSTESDLYDQEIKDDFLALAEKCEALGFDFLFFTAISKHESTCSFSEKGGILKISSADKDELKEEGVAIKWTVTKDWFFG